MFIEDHSLNPWARRSSSSVEMISSLKAARSSAIICAKSEDLLV